MIMCNKERKPATRTGNRRGTVAAEPVRPYRPATRFGNKEGKKVEPMEPIEAGVYEALDYLNKAQARTERNMKAVLRHLGLVPAADPDRNDPDLVIVNCQTDSNGAGHDPQQGTD